MNEQVSATEKRSRRPLGLRHILFSTDHRTIGAAYLLLALAAVGVGTVLSLLMRVHLAWPALRLPFFAEVRPEQYLALVTMHGTLMIFFVLTTAPQNGFGNLVLPEQIGARAMAFPRVNLAGFWITLLSFLTLLCAFLVPGGAPISGWSSYPPFSALASSGPGQSGGMDLWILSIGLFCVASWLSAVNTLTTIARMRAKNMTLSRMPLTVWAWLVAALLSLLSFSVLLAAVLLLFCDRHAGTSFFLPAGLVVNGAVQQHHGDGSPLLWLHLFWFFGHPEVYIAILPGMGLASMLVMNFSIRPVRSYRGMIASTLLIGLLGFVVWGHHMFVSGMNPYAGSAFALSTMVIAIPSTAKVLGWLEVLWHGGVERSTPMLFVLGFISFFIAGGLTGPILAQPALDSYLHNTWFVLAHFHLIMAMAGIFGMFAASYYWFPLFNGRMLDEKLGRWHFWLTLIPAYLVFFPMHFAGLAGMPRHFSQLTGTTGDYLGGLLSLQRWISFWALVLAGAQLLFLWNVIRSLRKGQEAADNPWSATTMEWMPPNRFPADEKAEVFCAPDQYGVAYSGRDWRAQWEAGEVPE